MLVLPPRQRELRASDGKKTYSYDQANRLKQVAQGALTTTLAYNGVGDRLSQTMGAATTHYVLDPGAGLTQVLSDGTTTYLYGPSTGSGQASRLAQYQSAVQYFGPDGLGSVRQIYDASAQVIGNARYDPYGNVMAQSGSTSVFAFAGEQYDAATGLEYLRARYYSSAQGRFVTRDVWEGDPNAPMSYNAWLYAYANAVNRIDPSGRSATLLGPEQAMARLAAMGSASTDLNPSDDDITSMLDCLLKGLSDPVASSLKSLIASRRHHIDDSDPQGYFVGASVTKTLGFAKTGIRGVDVVYDFKHQERGVFTYEGVAVNTTLIGMEGAAYEGFVWGFTSGVEDYKGPFVSASAGAGLPLGKILGVNWSGSVFSSAEKSNCAPNFQMMGVALSTSGAAGFSPIPVFSGSISCSSYDYADIGRASYTRGLVGGLQMGLEIQVIGGHWKETAIDYAVQWAIAAEERKGQVDGF